MQQWNECNLAKLMLGNSFLRAQHSVVSQNLAILAALYKAEARAGKGHSVTRPRHQPAGPMASPRAVVAAPGANGGGGRGGEQGRSGDRRWSVRGRPHLHLHLQPPSSCTSTSTSRPSKVSILPTSFTLQMLAHQPAFKLKTSCIALLKHCTTSIQVP